MQETGVTGVTLERAMEEAAGGNWRRESLTRKAYRQLEELIVTLALPPGAAVSETALAARLGIGRTPVREALQRLTREGLVEVLPRRGILVSRIDSCRQLRLLELRREVERLMSHSAAQRADEGERASFRRIADGMDDAGDKGDDIAFLRLDRELNLLLCVAARNEFIVNAMTLTHGLARRFWFAHYQRLADMPLAARLHAGLARAVADGDPQAAARASDRLMDHMQAFTRSTLQGEPAAAPAGPLAHDGGAHDGGARDIGAEA